MGNGYGAARMVARPELTEWDPSQLGHLTRAAFQVHVRAMLRAIRRGDGDAAKAFAIAAWHRAPAMVHHFQRERLRVLRLAHKEHLRKKGRA